MAEDPNQVSDLGVGKEVREGTPEIPEGAVEPIRVAYLTDSDTFKINTVAGTPVKVLEEQPTRIVFSIVNNSDTDFYMGYDENVATSGAKRGILVSANGGSLEDTHAKGEIWVICASAGKAIQVQYTKKKGRIEL